MNIDVCKEQIKRHEGEVLEVYLDSLDLKTLGIGHLLQSIVTEACLDLKVAGLHDQANYYLKTFDLQIPEEIIESIEDTIELELEEDEH